MALTDNIQAMTQSQLEADLAELIRYESQSQLDGGSTTRKTAARALSMYNGRGGEARALALAAEMKRKGYWDAWLAKQTTTSFFEGVIKPFVSTIATVAGTMIVGAAAISGAGALISAAGAAAGVPVVFGSQAAAAAAVAATAAAAPVAAVALPTSASITMLGVNTGVTTGMVAADAAIGAAATGAAGGAIASGVSGGNMIEGAQAGAQKAVLSSAATAIKSLVPSVDLNLPKINIPGWSNAGLLDEIIKNALNVAPSSVTGAAAVPVVVEQVQPAGEVSKQVGFNLDWKQVAGIVAGVVGVVSILR